MTHDAVLRPGARVEQVFAGGFWTEGPAFAPDGCVYFCDVTMTFRTENAAGNIWRHDPRTGETTIFRSPSGMAAGIKFDSRGYMLCATGADFGSRSIIRTDMRTGRSTILAGLYKGRPFNAPNDLDVDAQDRVYFTDPRYFGHEAVEQPVFGVYRIDPDGQVSLILADVARPNGIALGRDTQSLFVAEHDSMRSDRRVGDVPVRNGPMRLLRYDLSATGIASGRQVLVDYGDEAGADGITIDAAGRLYAAVQAASRPGVRVYDPSGREIAHIEVPEVPTNMTFAPLVGGPWLYITAGAGLYRVAVTYACVERKARSGEAAYAKRRAGGHAEECSGSSYAN